MMSSYDFRILEVVTYLPTDLAPFRVSVCQLACSVRGLELIFIAYTWSTRKGHVLTKSGVLIVC